MSQLNVIGHPRSHDTIERVVGVLHPCKILDAPAGEGSFCEFLRERGWTVHAADIDRGNFKLTDVPFTCVNLNRQLPFDNESFDAVSCVNGLHRLIQPEAAIREFFRVLAPGGHLYVNVNNYSSIWRRLRFLITGSVDPMIDSQECIQTIDSPEANVRILFSFARLARGLKDAGFVVRDVKPAANTLRDRILAPIGAILRVATYLIPWRATEAIGVRENNRSAVLAGGAYVFVDAMKPDSVRVTDREKL